MAGLALLCAGARLSIRAQEHGLDLRRNPYPQRPPAPQAVIDRGKALYGVNCSFCHGSDAAGGVGPNLLRSSVVLQDLNGELIAPIVHGARADRGMPRLNLTDAQVSDIAAFLHSLTVTSHAPPEKINILVGDPVAGKAYFEEKCASCHSATGDLKGIATRIPDPKVLQQTWLLPGGPGGRFGRFALAASGVHVPPVTVTVTLPSGKQYEGNLARIDDFYVGLVEPDGTNLGFSRNGDNPKVEIHDPVAAHRALFKVYTDRDIHNVTAYLVTLK